MIDIMRKRKSITFVVCVIACHFVTTANSIALRPKHAKSNENTSTNPTSHETSEEILAKIIEIQKELDKYTDENDPVYLLKQINDDPIIDNNYDWRRSPINYYTPITINSPYPHVQTHVHIPSLTKPLYYDEMLPIRSARNVNGSTPDSPYVVQPYWYPNAGYYGPEEVFVDDYGSFEDPIASESRHRGSIARVRPSEVGLTSSSSSSVSSASSSSSSSRADVANILERVNFQYHPTGVKLSLDDGPAEYRHRSGIRVLPFVKERTIYYNPDRVLVNVHGRLNHRDEIHVANGRGYGRDLNVKVANNEVIRDFGVIDTGDVSGVLDARITGSLRNSDRVDQLNTVQSGEKGTINLHISGVLNKDGEQINVDHVKRYEINPSDVHERERLQLDRHAPYVHEHVKELKNKHTLQTNEKFHQSSTEILHENVRAGGEHARANKYEHVNIYGDGNRERIYEHNRDGGSYSNEYERARYGNDERFREYKGRNHEHVSESGHEHARIHTSDASVTGREHEHLRLDQTRNGVRVGEHHAGHVYVHEKTRPSLSGDYDHHAPKHHVVGHYEHPEHHSSRERVLINHHIHERPSHDHISINNHHQHGSETLIHQQQNQNKIVNVHGGHKSHEHEHEASREILIDQNENQNVVLSSGNGRGNVLINQHGREHNTVVVDNQSRGGSGNVLVHENQNQHVNVHGGSVLIDEHQHQGTVIADNHARHGSGSVVVLENQNQHESVNVHEARNGGNILIDEHQHQGSVIVSDSRGGHGSGSVLVSENQNQHEIVNVHEAGNVGNILIGEHQHQDNTIVSGQHDSGTVSLNENQNQHEFVNLNGGHSNGNILINEHEHQENVVVSHQPSHHGSGSVLVSENQNQHGILNVHGNRHGENIVINEHQNQGNTKVSHQPNRHGSGSVLVSENQNQHEIVNVHGGHHGGNVLINEHQHQENTVVSHQPNHHGSGSVLVSENQNQHESVNVHGDRHGQDILINEHQHQENVVVSHQPTHHGSGSHHGILVNENQNQHESVNVHGGRHGENILINEHQRQENTVVSHENNHHGSGSVLVNQHHNQHEIVNVNGGRHVQNILINDHENQDNTLITQQQNHHKSGEVFVSENQNHNVRGGHHGGNILVNNHQHQDNAVVSHHDHHGSGTVLINQHQNQHEIHNVHGGRHGENILINEHQHQENGVVSHHGHHHGSGTVLVNQNQHESFNLNGGGRGENILINEHQNQGNVVVSHDQNHHGSGSVLVSENQNQHEIVNLNGDHQRENILINEHQNQGNTVVSNQQNHYGSGSVVVNQHQNQNEIVNLNGGHQRENILINEHEHQDNIVVSHQPSHQGSGTVFVKQNENQHEIVNINGGRQNENILINEHQHQAVIAQQGNHGSEGVLVHQSQNQHEIVDVHGPRQGGHILINEHQNQGNTVVSHQQGNHGSGSVVVNQNQHQHEYVNLNGGHQTENILINEHQNQENTVVSHQQNHYGSGNVLVNQYQNQHEYVNLNGGRQSGNILINEHQNQGNTVVSHQQGQHGSESVLVSQNQNQNEFVNIHGAPHQNVLIQNQQNQGSFMVSHGVNQHQNQQEYINYKQGAIATGTSGYLGGQYQENVRYYNQPEGNQRYQGAYNQQYTNQGRFKTFNTNQNPHPIIYQHNQQGIRFNSNQEHLQESFEVTTPHKRFSQEDIVESHPEVIVNTQNIKITSSESSSGDVFNQPIYIDANKPVAADRRGYESSSQSTSSQILSPIVNEDQKVTVHEHVTITLDNVNNHNVDRQGAQYENAHVDGKVRVYDANNEVIQDEYLHVGSGEIEGNNQDGSGQFTRITTPNQYVILNEEPVWSEQQKNEEILNAGSLLEGHLHSGEQTQTSQVVIEDSGRSSEVLGSGEAQYVSYPTSEVQEGLLESQSIPIIPQTQYISQNFNPESGEVYLSNKQQQNLLNNLKISENTHVSEQNGNVVVDQHERIHERIHSSEIIDVNGHEERVNIDGHIDVKVNSHEVEREGRPLVEVLSEDCDQRNIGRIGSVERINVGRMDSVERIGGSSVERINNLRPRLPQVYPQTVPIMYYDDYRQAPNSQEVSALLLQEEENTLQAQQRLIQQQNALKPVDIGYNSVEVVTNMDLSPVEEKRLQYFLGDCGNAAAPGSHRAFPGTVARDPLTNGRNAMRPRVGAVPRPRYPNQWDQRQPQQQFYHSNNYNNYYGKYKRNEEDGAFSEISYASNGDMNIPLITADVQEEYYPRLSPVSVINADSSSSEDFSEDIAVPGPRFPQVITVPIAALGQENDDISSNEDISLPTAPVATVDVPTETKLGLIEDLDPQVLQFNEPEPEPIWPVYEPEILTIDTKQEEQEVVKDIPVAIIDNDLQRRRKQKQQRQQKQRHGLYSFRERPCFRNCEGDPIREAELNGPRDFVENQEFRNIIEKLPRRQLVAVEKYQKVNVDQLKANVNGF